LSLPPTIRANLESDTGTGVGTGVEVGRTGCGLPGSTVGTTGVAVGVGVGVGDACSVGLAVTGDGVALGVTAVAVGSEIFTVGSTGDGFGVAVLVGETGNRVGTGDLTIFGSGCVVEVLFAIGVCVGIDLSGTGVVVGTRVGSTGEGESSMTTVDVGGSCATSVAVSVGSVKHATEAITKTGNTKSDRRCNSELASTKISPHPLHSKSSTTHDQ
jgi:hypothetical protein